jgi:cyclophilin family peptidyl-prolyl cis-trans isomerase
MRPLLRALAALLAAPLGAQPPTPPTLDQLIRAEDARGRTAADLAVLRAGAAAPDAERRRFAVRGMGRLEQPALLDDLVRALHDDDAGVRRAAADAVAQAVARGEGAPRARAALFAVLAVERDSAVRGQLAESAGRVRADSGDAAATAAALAEQLPLRGAVRGLFFLARQRAARGRIPADVGRRLQEVATTASLSDDVRATAAAARLAVGGATAEDSAALRRDSSGDVRALVATAASIGDPAPAVRYRAVALAGCPALTAATRDTNAHVALAAVDALARCGGDADAVAALERAAGAPSAAGARALAALAGAAPERARVRLAGATRAADPFARTWAARAARRLADTTTLRRLARDPDANVASEAIDGLTAVAGRADVATYAAALRRDAAQVLMSAAAALRGAGDTAALAAALDRVSARRRETSRDARLALVEALGAAVPARYARDFDPAVAERAAALAGVPAAPQPLPPRSVPTVAQLRALRGATVVMADGGRVELRLFPMDAPTNSWRFARLARAGYFDGLTFHRVAPFFVVQGGSPYANEYEGDGPFTRDEVGLENRRGTVGVSTRGRDTGDGQLYVNTVDNVRLDHDYTVFAEVVSGMDVVDRVQEGARIRRVIVR